VNRDDAAVDSQSGLQLFERGIGSLPDELVELPHLRVVQCGRIVSARQWPGAAGLPIAVQPPLKSRQVNAIEFRHMLLRATPRLVGRNGSLPDLSICYSHVSIIMIALHHVNIKML
jgi:hypothetical protein